MLDLLSVFVFLSCRLFRFDVSLYVQVVIFSITSQKPPGMMAILDDVCNFPKGTDEKFLGKLSEAFGSHAHYANSSTANRFIIKHYAGTFPPLPSSF